MTESAHVGLATEALWRDLRSRLLAFIRGRVATREDAEDILQNVFARIHENAARLDELESVSGWVHGVARNAVIDHHRRRAARERAASSLLADSPIASNAGEDEAENELAGCLAPMVAGLPERYRRALELTELEGKSQRQAAEELGLSLSGVKSRVQRGRSKLRERLLDCCHVELGRRGSVVGFTPREPACRRCSSPVEKKR